ncbi:MAG: hypothetical protein NW241_09665 [Bacteroidia bacterium]|nr:hypothetical protein [Bacteroidia bacterium]
MEELLQQFSPGSQALIKALSDQPGLPWHAWVRECALRKRELSRPEYIKWLRDKREESIKGAAGATDDSPAGRYHLGLLPLIRQEILESDAASPDQPGDAESIAREASHLIMEGKLGAALKMAHTFFEQHSQYRDQQFETVHLLSEFNLYEEKERSGVMNHESLTAARSHIRNALLGLLKELK